MKDKQIRVGIIGLGYIGKVHAAAYTAIPTFEENGRQANWQRCCHPHRRRALLIASLGNRWKHDIRDSSIRT